MHCQLFFLINLITILHSDRLRLSQFNWCGLLKYTIYLCHSYGIRIHKTHHPPNAYCVWFSNSKYWLCTVHCAARAYSFHLMHIAFNIFFYYYITDRVRRSQSSEEKNIKQTKNNTYTSVLDLVHNNNSIHSLHRWISVLAFISVEPVSAGFIRS